MDMVLTQSSAVVGSRRWRLAILAGVLLSLFLPLVGSSEQIPAKDCPPHRGQEPDNRVSLFLLPVEDSLGSVCLHVGNGLQSDILVFPFFRLEAWKPDTEGQAGHFHDLLGLRELKFATSDGIAVPPGGSFESRQPLASRELPAGRYRFCFPYGRPGRKEEEDLCSEEFSLPMTLFGCPPLPVQAPANTVTLYAAPAMDQPGVVCVRVINALGEQVKIAGGFGRSGRFRVQKWEAGSWGRKGKFRFYTAPGAAIPIAGLGGGGLLAGGIIDEQIPLGASPGQYQVCFCYVRSGQPECVDLCSEEFLVN